MGVPTLLVAFAVGIAVAVGAMALLLTHSWWLLAVAFCIAIIAHAAVLGVIFRHIDGRTEENVAR
jgi:membrane protein implicated in regulation of membrane protease activity